MNYYPFHIGDYLSATRHLSWEEDAAFRRLLDTYYTTEKPLPNDMRSVCRLVLATTDSQREAVQVVLDEFFEKTADGWINKRADAEISAMRDKQHQRDVKDAHESERMRRYRERRAAMFSDLRGKEVVPPWDIPMKELQRLHDETCNAPATHLQRERSFSCNESATAIPTPTPTPTPKALKAKSLVQQAARFAEFWAAYPVKKGRAEAESKWRAKGYDAIADTILADVQRRMAEDRQWCEGYIPHGSTYVNGRGWEDGIEPARPEKTQSSELPDFMRGMI